MDESELALPDIGTHLRGEKVLITGSTGYVGLALIEKLLRSVPDISTVYILIRDKRGKTVEQRFQDILANPVFDKIRNSDYIASLDKMKPLVGSIEQDDLGLSDRDIQAVIYNVSYVFHCAATLDFEASLKTTVEINVLGTRRVIALCRKLSKLKCLVHVSSAYANANILDVNEVLYPPPADVDDIIKMVSSMPNSEIEEMTPSLLKDHPNTYTFTKALAEHEVAKGFKDVNSCIVRPSMIVGAWKEPFPGWTASKNGPTGFIMGASTGVVRRLPVAKHLIYDYIPVDTVVNMIIVSAVYTARQRRRLNEVPIFHVTSSTIKPFRWANVEEKLPHLLHSYPVMQAVWYPNLILMPSIWRFRISAFLFHIIPAHVLDTVAKISGSRPKLVKLHHNINSSLDRLAPFIFTEWKFACPNTLRLQEVLSPADKTTFNVDMRTLEWDPFFNDMAMGVRRYLLKEKDSTLPAAKRKNQWLRLGNILLQVALFCLLWTILKLIGGFTWGEAMAILPLFALIYFYL